MLVGYSFVYYNLSGVMKTVSEPKRAHKNVQQQAVSEVESI